MLPWNYGFEWNPGHVIFLGAFYTVVVIVATTVVLALLRARRDLGTHHEEAIRWHSDFHDLPAADRDCRHVLDGRVPPPQMPQWLRLPELRNPRAVDRESSGGSGSGSRRRGPGDVLPARPVLPPRPCLGISTAGWYGDHRP